MAKIADEMRKNDLEVSNIVLSCEPAASRNILYENSINVLFGRLGIGKTAFVYELNKILKQRYAAVIDPIWVIPTEVINHKLSLRGVGPTSRKVNWPTLVKFIDDCYKDRAFVRTVKMFALDTIDGIVPSLLSQVCKDYSLDIGSDKDNAPLYNIAKQYLEYAVLRLRALGPGVLILAHEREDKRRAGVVEKFVTSMKLSGSMADQIGAAVSTLVRMRDIKWTPRSVAQKKQSAEGPPAERCLAFQPRLEEVVKDNVGSLRKAYPEGIIPFGTQREAVEKLMACFDLPKTSKKKHAKKKSAKKVAHRG